jgi:arsenite methyltransferase
VKRKRNAGEIGFWWIRYEKMFIVTPSDACMAQRGRRKNMSVLKEINNRYSALAKENCCLSCGGAINLAEVRSGDVCVDLGSGRGLDVIEMAQKSGPDGFAYGVDTADGMIRTAESTARKMGVVNVKFVKANLESIPLEDNLADLIISNCTINHAPDKGAVWREVFRLLKPGGRFVVSDIYATATVPLEYRDDPVAVAECWAGAVTRDEYMETLRESGFVNIVVLEESKPYDKGKIQVSSMTVAGLKPGGCCC